MRVRSKLFEWRTRDGEPVAAGGVTVTPRSQALVVRWPKGGFVWNRPLALLVTRDGETERIPVVDVTLLAQAALLGLAVVFSIATLVISAQNGRE